MSRGWNYVSGAWNFICDVCGQKHKSTVGRERWDGLQVCPLCFELRHPQDFVKSKGDKITVDWMRPPSDTFVAEVCSTQTLSCLADYGGANCATVGLNFI